jgi:ribosomal protein S18
VKFVPEIILTEEGALKILWEEQTYFTAINQKLLRRAIKTAASSELNKQQWVFFF